MPKRELTRLTWPLPWWAVAVPAVVVAVVSYFYVSLAGGWAYLSGSQLSGMLRESLVISGPLACLAATWIAERFVNRRSPVAAPTVWRATGQQGLRVLVVLVAAWCLALIAGGWTSTAVQFSAATGGSLDYLELFFPLPALCFLIVTGFLIGIVIARWHAVLWSALWCLCWLGALPLYYTTILPDPRTSTEFFLFPAPAALEHAPLFAAPVIVMAGWWLLALAALTMLLVAWFRQQSRRSQRALPAATGGVIVACLLGVALQQTLPTPFQSTRPVVPITCQELSPVTVCVTDEQRPLLSVITHRAEVVLERMGAHFPGQITTFATSSAIPALVAAGHARADLISIGASTAGARTVEMDVGVGLAGLDSCNPGTSNPLAINWAFALGTWIARNPDPSYLSDPLRIELETLPPEAVLAWYSQHADQFLACRYVGAGPA